MCGMAITLIRIELFCSQISESQDSGARRTCREVKSCHGTSQENRRRTEISSPFQWMRMMLFWKWRHDDWIGWIIDPIQETSIFSFGDLLLKSCCLALATAPHTAEPFKDTGPLSLQALKNMWHVRWWMPTWWKTIVWHLAGHTFILCKLAFIHSQKRKYSSIKATKMGQLEPCFINKINQPHQVWEKLPCESVACQWLDQLKGHVFFRRVGKMGPADHGRLIHKFLGPWGTSEVFLKVSRVFFVFFGSLLYSSMIWVFPKIVVPPNHPF